MKQTDSGSSKRTLGLAGATSVGVGAIVGGGILALAGAAFSQAGPSAMLAFALNGIIALLTAWSFSEVASKFPESGGTYTFSKKVLSVEAAFTVGWTVWFASIVAAALYALGFAQFAVAVASEIAAGAGATQFQSWIAAPIVARTIAVASVIAYSVILLFRSGGGGYWENAGKLIVFFLLIVLGLWYAKDRQVTDLQGSLSPFFAGGAAGLFQAMGYTFIALQGFDLIAAVGGEVRNPTKTIPRAMFLSLAIALVVYLPLLFVITTVGVPPGTSISEASRANPETIIAESARNYLGAFGYWLVMVAGLLSMLSALQANLFAASRVAQAMARDRTLPGILAKAFRGGVPRYSVLLTAGIVVLIAILLPDLAAAGAASSLIFLVTFALAHWICVLVRQRSKHRPPPFRTPWFPSVPLLGGLACLMLAIYQGMMVPSAGAIATTWLALGAGLFLFLFAHRARLSDITSGIRDPELLRMRGRSPLALVPIANPANAANLVALADEITPRGAGRVLLLAVAVAPKDWDYESNPKPLENTQSVLRKALASSIKADLNPEALTTIATDPWAEIQRVARTHRCESIVLGFTRLTDERIETPLERLVTKVGCEAVILRSPIGWQLEQARRILVPTIGLRLDDPLLARLLASLSKSVEREITFLNVLPETSSALEIRKSQRELASWVHSLCSSSGHVEVIASANPLATIVEHVDEAELTIMSHRRGKGNEQAFSDFIWQVIEKTDKPLLLGSHRAR